VRAQTAQRNRLARAVFDEVESSTEDAKVHPPVPGRRERVRRRETGEQRPVGTRDREADHLLATTPGLGPARPDVIPESRLGHLHGPHLLGSESLDPRAAAQPRPAASAVQERWEGERQDRRAAQSEKEHADRQSRSGRKERQGEERERGGGQRPKNLEDAGRCVEARHDDHRREKDARADARRRPP